MLLRARLLRELARLFKEDGLLRHRPMSRSSHPETDYPSTRSTGSTLVSPTARSRSTRRLGFYGQWQIQRSHPSVHRDNVVVSPSGIGTRGIQHARRLAEPCYPTTSGLTRSSRSSCSQDPMTRIASTARKGLGCHAARPRLRPKPFVKPLRPRIHRDDHVTASTTPPTPTDVLQAIRRDPRGRPRRVPPARLPRFAVDWSTLCDRRGQPSARPSRTVGLRVPEGDIGWDEFADRLGSLLEGRRRVAGVVTTLRFAQQPFALRS